MHVSGQWATPKTLKSSKSEIEEIIQMLSFPNVTLPGLRGSICGNDREKMGHFPGWDPTARCATVVALVTAILVTCHSYTFLLPQ